MNDINGQFLENWLLTGDSSQYIFLKWLMLGYGLQTGKNFSKQNILAEYGPEMQAYAKEDKVVFRNPLLMPFTGYHFPKLGYLCQDINLKNLICFEEEPFCKESTFKDIEALHKAHPESYICVVLMDLERHHACSDLLPDGEDVKLAVAKYSDKGYPVFTVKDENDVSKVLAWHGSGFQQWTQKFTEDLKSFSLGINDIDTDFELLLDDFQLDDGILSVKVKDALSNHTVFKTAVQENKPIWQAFCTSAEEKLFPVSESGGIYDFISVYFQKIEDSNLLLWDVEEEKKRLIEKLREHFKAKFGKSIFFGVTNTKYLDENGYYNAVNDKNDKLYGIVAEFTGLYNSFIKEDVTSFFKKQLLRNYKRMRGLINAR